MPSSPKPPPPARQVSEPRTRSPTPARATAPTGCWLRKELPEGTPTRCGPVAPGADDGGGGVRRGPALPGPGGGGDLGAPVGPLPLFDVFDVFAEVLGRGGGSLTLSHPELSLALPADLPERSLRDRS